MAVIGYGSQGHAHALNLKESGVDVVVGLRAGSNRVGRGRRAPALTVMDPAEAAAWADVVMMLVPDQVMGTIYAESIAPNLESRRHPALRPRVQHPFRGDRPARGHRRRNGGAQRARDIWCGAPTPGVGSCPACSQCIRTPSGHARDLGLSYASAIGGGRAGILETTFKEETETDLFGEQVILCGGVSELIKASFETLVEAGYQPESAYFETLHELKLIVDLLYEGGLSWMRYSVSDTAEYGDYTRGSRIITEETRAAMKQDPRTRSSRVRSPTSGWPRPGREPRSSTSNGRLNQAHQIEDVGKELRTMMPFMEPKTAP